MKISEIPVKSTITSVDLLEGYTLGMKNIYPDDDIPVHELQKFPISAYISDIDLNTTKQLVKRVRTISSEIADEYNKLKSTVSKVKLMTLEDIEKANLQSSNNVISYTETTSQLLSKFATAEELQNSVNNVYTELFSAVEEIMVQVFTMSMYARQYTPIIDDPGYTEPEWPTQVTSTNQSGS